MTDGLHTRAAPAGRRHEVVMGLLALAVVPALFLEEHSDGRLQLAALVTNWLIWLAFLGDFITHWRHARWSRHFLRRSWFDLALLVLSPPFLVPAAMQSLRSFRALRAFRLLRVVRSLSLLIIGLRVSRQALQRHNFHYVLLVTAATVGLGSVAIYLLEGGNNQAIRTVDDALWWAVVTTTTVGYGDVSPTTGPGRVVAVALMLVGIAVIGVFTGSVASGTTCRPRRARTASARPVPPYVADARLVDDVRHERGHSGFHFLACLIHEDLLAG
jgi:voltage-gated potassium channel